MMWMMGLGMLLFWVLILGGGVWLAQTPAQGESPLDILKKRYSRGEITKEQFQDMKRDLGL